jgi:peptide/nickel transport system substrate-binding protein
MDWSRHFGRCTVATALASALTLSDACHRTAKGPAEGATLTLGASTSIALDATTGQLPLWVDVAVREPLVSIAWDGRPVGRLADRWETSASGTELTIFLRNDVRFHDGTALTPEQAAIAVDRAIQEKQFRFSNPLSARLEHGAVVITLRHPEAFVLTDLAELHLSPNKLPLIGTGPFRVERTGSSIVVRASETYYRGRPSLDRVEFRGYQTQRSAWAAMMRGEIDAVHEVSRDAVQFVEAESAVRSYSFLRPYYTVLAFNTRHPVFRNPTVRQAMNLAIDRQKLIDQAMRGRGVPAEGPIWPHNWAHAPLPRKYTFNPEAAALLLDKAGYSRRRQRSGRMPSRFSFECLLWAGDPRFERHALVLQKQLAELDIDMRIVPVEPAEWRRRLNDGLFDVYLSEQTSGRSLGWSYFFWHSPQPDLPGGVATGYTAANLPLDRLRRAQSDAETRSALSDLQRVLYEDPPAVFLAWGEGTRAVRHDFVVPADSPPDIMGSLWQWRRVQPMSARR